MTASEELISVATTFGEATADAGRTLISLIPGINLLGTEEVVEDTALSQALRGGFTDLSAFAFLVFVLLYIPCIATVSAIKQEFGWHWAVVSAVYQTFLAWLAATMIFQIGTLLGFG